MQTVEIWIMDFEWLLTLQHETRLKKKKKEKENIKFTSQFYKKDQIFTLKNGDVPRFMLHRCVVNVQGGGEGGTLKLKCLKCIRVNAADGWHSGLVRHTEPVPRCTQVDERVAFSRWFTQCSSRSVVTGAASLLPRLQMTAESYKARSCLHITAWM